jgi:hypothetical protein
MSLPVFYFVFLFHPFFHSLHFADSFVVISDAVIKDVKSVIDSVKHQRSDNARAAVSIICASINGNSVEKLRHTKKLAKKLVSQSGECLEVKLFVIRY